jgi:hypothetical protein
MLGHFAFMGFMAMWNCTRSERWPTRKRFFLGGVTGGVAVLFDYSGVVLLLGLFAYGVIKRIQEASFPDAIRHGLWYILGTLGPAGLLWFYQWKSFGNPFLPGQHWMPPVEWIELGYQGYNWPQMELFLALLFDYRFGIFVSCPLMLFALVSPFFERGRRRTLPRLELAFILTISLAFVIFFSGSNYTRLQFNTGIRYLAPIFPFLFLPAVVVLKRLPRLAIYFVAVVSVTLSWCMAMYREVELGLGVMETVLQVFLGGFQLPVLTTLARMGGYYGDYFAHGVSPLPLLVMAAAILYGIWLPRPQSSR